LTIHIGAVEMVWLGVTFLALMLAIREYIEARRDRDTVRRLNGRAREVAAVGSVRREGLRVVILGLLLSVAVPGIFSDREIVLSPAITALMLVPCLLLLGAYLDGRERRLLTAIVAHETR
jgi:NADH:ubiquinone oxidoreductase subunit 4 (subunit M)